MQSESCTFPAWKVGHNPVHFPVEGRSFLRRLLWLSMATSNPCPANMTVTTCKPGAVAHTKKNLRAIWLANYQTWFCQVTAVASCGIVFSGSTKRALLGVCDLWVRPSGVMNTGNSMKFLHLVWWFSSLTNPNFLTMGQFSASHVQTGGWPTKAKHCWELPPPGFARGSVPQEHQHAFAPPRLQRWDSCGIHPAINLPWLGTVWIRAIWWFGG